MSSVFLKCVCVLWSMFQLLFMCLIFSPYGRSQISNSPHQPHDEKPSTKATPVTTPTTTPTVHSTIETTSVVAGTTIPSPTVTVPPTKVSVVPHTTSSSTTTPSPVSTSTPASGSSNDAPKPITLTLNPDVRQIIEDSHSVYNYYTLWDGHTNMTCSISGTNLPKIQPYKLCWYIQGDGGKNTMIHHMHNARTIVLDKSLIKEYRGSLIYCAVVFNEKTPRYFATMKTHYIKLKSSKSTTNAQLRKSKTTQNHFGVRGASEYESKGPTNWVIIITGLVGVLLLGLMAGFLFKRYKKPKPRTTHISEDPSVSAQDNVYSYVPLETVSFYQAKALAAANTPKVQESVGPPPLPERPHRERTINEEEEYIYSYAYGVRPRHY